jgi:hypothetical protein
MRRRRLLLALVAIAVLVAVGMVVPWPRPPDRVTQANCRLVSRGMALAEVEAILGPPGDYRTGPTIWDLNFPPVRFVNPDPTCEWVHWDGDAASLSVTFNSQRKVLNTYYTPNQSLDKGPLDNLLWRAKRQWRRWFP